jgi:hypothetical protein
MVTFAETIDMKCQTTGTYSSFKAFVDSQTDIFVESMQDEADNQWHTFRWQMEGASDEDVGRKMERWWNHKIRRFQDRLRQTHIRDLYRQGRQDKRRLDCETNQRREIEGRLQAAEEKVEQLQVDGMNDRAFMQFQKEQLRCRECNTSLWN